MTITRLYDAASDDPRTAQDWAGTWAYLPDATATWYREGDRLGTRAWKLLANDPNVQALAICLRMQILGDGLWFRSTYGGESPSAAARSTRRAITTWVQDSASGTRRDAGGDLTRVDQDTQTLLAGFFQGDGWNVRVWDPARPGAGRHGTCWRVVEPERVSTPDKKAGDGNVINGIQYDARGRASGIWVRRWEPADSYLYSISRSSATSDLIPLYDDAGNPQVLHAAPFRWRPGTRGLPAIASSLLLIRQLQQLQAAHLSGKRIQASHPIIIECVDPAKAASEYQRRVDSGEIVDQAAVLFVPQNSKPTLTNTNYQGSDLTAVSDLYARAMCASIGYPLEYVLCTYGQGSLANTQAALDQAERTTAVYQDQWINQVARPADEASIREGWAKGIFGAIPWSDDLLAGEYQRPRRADANRLRSRQAGLLSLQLGASPSTVHAELGLDYETELQRAAEDRQLAAQYGLPAPGAPTPAAQVAPAPTGERHADPAGDPASDQAEDEQQTQGQEQAQDDKPAA